jgi:glucose dehydrogenase
MRRPSGFKTGILYLPVGNPAPDFFGEIRPGTNLYTNSVVAGNVCCRHKADVMSCSPR